MPYKQRQRTIASKQMKATTLLPLHFDSQSTNDYDDDDDDDFQKRKNHRKNFNNNRIVLNLKRMSAQFANFVFATYVYVPLNVLHNMPVYIGKCSSL